MAEWLIEWLMAVPAWPHLTHPPGHQPFSFLERGSFNAQASAFPRLAAQSYSDRRRKGGWITCGKGIGGCVVHEIVCAPSCAFSQLPEPMALFRQVAFTGERPPYEGAANPGEQSSRDGPVSQAVQRQRAAADADEQTCNGEMLTRPVPAPAIPDADGRSMGFQVQSMVVSHGADRLQVPGQ